MKESAEPTSLRLDKWLWAARFFKTRGLAAEAIKGGKVIVNGARAKPAKNVQTGDGLCVRRGPYEYKLTVLRLSAQRGPATQAASLYQEHPESVERREQLALQLQAASATRSHSPGRPSKRDRRQILRFTQKGKA